MVSRNGLAPIHVGNNGDTFVLPSEILASANGAAAVKRLDARFRCDHANDVPFAIPRWSIYATGGECFICGAKWRVVNGRKVLLTGEEADD